MYSVPNICIFICAGIYTRRFFFFFNVGFITMSWKQWGEKTQKKTPKAVENISLPKITLFDKFFRQTFIFCLMRRNKYTLFHCDNFLPNLRVLCSVSGSDYCPVLCSLSFGSRFMIIIGKSPDLCLVFFWILILSTVSDWFACLFYV